MNFILQLDKFMVFEKYPYKTVFFFLFNFCKVGNARLDEAQSGIKIAGRNINNLRYADDTTLMAEREEELKSLLMKVRGE